MVSYFLWFFFKGKIWLFFFLDPWRPWIFPWLCSEFFMGLMEQKIPGPMKSRLISNGRIQKGFLEELLWYRCIHGHLVYKSSSCSRQPRLCFEIKWNKYSTSSLVRGALCRCFFCFSPIISCLGVDHFIVGWSPSTDFFDGDFRSWNKLVLTVSSCYGLTIVQPDFLWEAFEQVLCLDKLW